MWSVQAVAEPPNNVLSLQHGQIVITCPEMKSSPAEPAATLVGHAKTLEMCRQPDGKGTDPWLTSDPWSKAVSSVPAAPSGPPVQHVLHEFEQRLEQSILAKLPPQDKMEADDQDQRLQMLEAHFKQFSNRQTALETTVNDHHQQSTAQVQSLQQQMKVQLDVQNTANAEHAHGPDGQNRNHSGQEATHWVKTRGPSLCAHGSGDPRALSPYPGTLVSVFNFVHVSHWWSSCSWPWHLESVDLQPFWAAGETLHFEQCPCRCCSH